MNKLEFSAVRHRLEKSQVEMAALLGVSVKAVQSFEQGWRKVPVQAERQALFLLASKTALEKDRHPCWEIRRCSPEERENCPAREFSLGNLCWFVNGVHCHGQKLRSWHDKMKLCRQCNVYRDAGLAGLAAE